MTSPTVVQLPHHSSLFEVSCRREYNFTPCVGHGERRESPESFMAGRASRKGMLEDARALLPMGWGKLACAPGRVTDKTKEGGSRKRTSVTGSMLGPKLPYFLSNLQVTQLSIPPWQGTIFFCAKRSSHPSCSVRCSNHFDTHMLASDLPHSPADPTRPPHPRPVTAG